MEHEGGRSPYQLSDEVGRKKSQGSVSSEADRRFKDLLNQLLEEHTMTVSELFQVNEQLRLEIMELQLGSQNHEAAGSAHLQFQTQDLGLWKSQWKR